MAAQVEIFVQPRTTVRPCERTKSADGLQGRDICGDGCVPAGEALGGELVVTREVAGVGSFCERCGEGGPIRPGGQGHRWCQG